MSIQWMQRVWELSGQKGTPLLAMLAIADNANDYGVAWPGFGTLARKTRMSDRTIPRVISLLSNAQELAFHSGGAGRRDTNIYVLLLGRDPSEVESILKMLKQKHVNLSSLKGGQFVILDKISVKRTARKHDIAVSGEPLRTMNDHGWMDDDPICKFLLGLPGFNPSIAESTRREIIAHHYDLAELPYLWNECALADNPIGRFTRKVEKGIHSVDWQMAQMQRDAEDERKRLAEADRVRLVEEVKRRSEEVARRCARVEPDSSVTDQHVSTWSLVVSELCVDLRKTTIQSYIVGNQLISVNGHWTIAVSHPEWWQRADKSIRRIYRGIAKNDMTFEYVEG